MTPGDATLLYELRVQLKAVDPPVWRLLQVRWDTTLHHLHEVLQVAMGWTNSHLYLFHVGDTVYGEPSSEWDTIVRDSTRAKLETIFSESGGSFLYEYDLGDSWMHAITLEGTLDVKGEEMARCTVAPELVRRRTVAGLRDTSTFLKRSRIRTTRSMARCLIGWVGDSNRRNSTYRRRTRR